jgi:methylmalonyl-CoA mutase N-terminal domain/subunit
VAAVADPLGGSWFVERMTLDMEHGAFEYFKKLDNLGGMVKAIEQGYPQKEIAEASYAYQRSVETKEKTIVGVNEYATDEQPQKILYIDESVREAQTKKLRKLRAERSNDAVQSTLSALCRAAEHEPQAADNGICSANTMPYLLDCVRAYATVGEIAGTLKQVMGEYREVSIA